MSCAVVAGGAGFIGSNLVRRLLKDGQNVICLDNLSNGSRLFLPNHPNLSFYECSLDDEQDTLRVFREISNIHHIDAIWHLAANSNIPLGVSDHRVDLNDTFLTTCNLLLATKEYCISKFMFASSSAVYGDHGVDQISEHKTICRPISNYGAMKLASESLLFAAKESYIDNIYIFRFPNVVGTPATHGVILDFITKLKHSPDNLEVLGNGTQTKQYLFVDDLIEAMLWITQNTHETTNSRDSSIFNIGPLDSGITVSEIAEIVVNEVSPNATIVFGKENHGWTGDIPKFNYNIDKLSLAGWTTQNDSHTAVTKAVKAIIHNQNND